MGGCYVDSVCLPLPAHDCRNGRDRRASTVDRSIADRGGPLFFSPVSCSLEQASGETMEPPAADFKAAFRGSPLAILPSYIGEK